MSPDSSAPAGQQQRRRLVAFDFDHTIADANSDTFIIRELPEGRLPPEVKKSYVPGRWTEYMQRVMDHMHAEAGIGADRLAACVAALPRVEGMDALLSELAARRGDGVDALILSDSNSLFIQSALEAWGHADTFHPPAARVFTNPAAAEPASGRLLLEPHDPGHGCGSCPANMCKRVTLARYLRARAAEGVEYDRIAYAGDGGNDLCPSLLMGPADVVFARRGFALEREIAARGWEGAEGGAGAGAGGGGLGGAAGGRRLPPERGGGGAPPAGPVAARVVLWESGDEILQWLRANWWRDGGGAE
ncbi:pyridoxal phosphate phosphatase [Raphidocelis subcapitata]|uniref:Pyridoxal phosphate phosphatase n=1 Tax=Raphidocelis subcapitata TaxID=307507 RepID=A0A2V0NUI7_9CHLO|nr:pyridoxal phosphate phosphatase [Raphidocelis subcapitata]|eukprot:GBF89230.1 pyridoxal phosphate phosphatase [Raphidocelis subcapitata]